MVFSQENLYSKPRCPPCKCRWEPEGQHGHSARGFQLGSLLLQEAIIRYFQAIKCKGKTSFFFFFFHFECFVGLF